MVMGTPIHVWFKMHMSLPLIIEDLFNCPSEAARSIFVDGFEHEQHGTKLKDCGTDEGCDTASSEDLIFELC